MYEKRDINTSSEANHSSTIRTRLVQVGLEKGRGFVGSKMIFEDFNVS